MDKNEKIALGIVGVTAIGIIGYKYLKERHTTVNTSTTTQHVTTSTSTTTSPPSTTTQHVTTSTSTTTSPPSTTTTSTGGNGTGITGQQNTGGNSGQGQTKLPRPYTVILNNSCSQSVTVNYTSAHGQSASVTVSPNSSKVIRTSTSFTVTLPNGQTQQFTPTMNYQAITICQGVQAPTYTISLVNKCNQTIAVDYTDSNGKTSTISVSANSTQTIQAQANTNIIATFPNGQQERFGPVTGNQSFTICGGHSVTLVNNCSESMPVTFTDPNGQNDELIVPGNGQITIQVLPNSMIGSARGTFGPVTDNGQTITICSPGPISSSGGNGYTVIVYNGCNPSVTAQYTTPSGQNAILTIPGRLGEYVTVKPASMITITYSDGSQKQFGPINSSNLVGAIVVCKCSEHPEWC